MEKNLTNHEPRIAVVTGGNRGLGFAICRNLAIKGFRVLLCSRDQKKGEIAARSLSSDGLDVIPHCLDITIEKSLEDFLNELKLNHKKIDVLINNAGALIDPPRHPPDTVGASIFHAPLNLIRQSLENNTLGALRLTQLVIPIMIQKNYGRIVNVSSGMGQLSEMNGGWPGYRISKVALNAVTRIFADELKDKNILINSVCPGWVRTEMGGPDAERSAEDAAESLSWLATLPDDGPSGCFFRDRDRIDW